LQLARDIRQRQQRPSGFARREPPQSRTSRPRLLDAGSASPPPSACSSCAPALAFRSLSARDVR
jgi:hypothetical protein